MFAIRHFRAVAGVIAISVLGLGVGITPAPAQADDNVTWTVRTASNAFGADRTGYTYAVNPGATVDDALVVANRGATSLDLGVYAADGFTTESGQFDLVVAGTKSTKVGAWVGTTDDKITIPAGGTLEVPFTLTVPENATPGDYAGGIVTSLLEPTGDNGINVDRRLGIKITLRVGGDLKPSLGIENFRVGWDGGFNPFAGGATTVAYTIRNTGNAVLAAQQTTTVTGPFGWFPYAGEKVAEVPQLLPGETWKVKVFVPGVAPVLLLLASAAVTPVVVDVSGSTTALAAVTATGTALALPWMLLLIVFVIVAAVILTVRSRRRGLLQRQEREDARVRDAVEEALAMEEGRR